MGIGQGGHKKVAEGAAKGEGGGGGKACPVADQQSKALYVKAGVGSGRVFCMLYVTELDGRCEVGTEWQ